MLKRILGIVMLAIGLGFAACAGLAFGGGVSLIAFFGFLFGLAYGYYTSVYAAVAMDFSDPHIAASMFAIYMMFVNIGTAGGQTVGGMLSERLGFNMMVLVMGAISLLSIPIVMGIFRKKPSTAAATGQEG